MTEPLSCFMCQQVDSPHPDAFYDLNRNCWLLPCPDPVAGIGHNGHPYCAWHLELIDEAPLMYFDVRDGRLEGPFYVEDADA